MIGYLQRLCVWFLSRYPVPEPVAVPDDEPAYDPNWFYDDSDFCESGYCVGMSYPPNAFTGPQGQCLCAACAFDVAGAVRRAA